jgi:sigma-B regulation protein RsbU (phosphoserine phosphatase)
MATVRAAVRARLAGSVDTPALGELLTTVNQVLLEIGRPDRFATLAALRLPERGDAEVALAGHLPVLRVRGGAIEHIENQHVPLGVRAGETFSASSVTTAPGDLFVLFTDGVIEVDDGAGNHLGLEALEAEILAHADQTLPVLHDRILARVRRHGRANDDVTLLLVKLS